MVNGGIGKFIGLQEPHGDMYLLQIIGTLAHWHIGTLILNFLYFCRNFFYL